MTTFRMVPTVNGRSQLERVWTVSDAFEASSGTIIRWDYSEAEDVTALISGGVCEWVYVRGNKLLITL